MATWIYFLHPPRDEFAATITDEERTAFARHWERLKRLFANGEIILAGPTLGRVNTGLCVFEAPDEASARALMEGDPVIAEGVLAGELREIHLALLRGRDEPWVRAEIDGTGAHGA